MPARERNEPRASAGPACLLLLCVVQAAAIHGVARAEPPERSGPPGDEQQRALAKQRFEQAVVDYDAERYEQALANFQEAHRLRPHPLVNVNIANCYDKLGRPLQAIFHFERFIESEAGTPAQRQEVAKAVERLRKQVGQLLLRVTPDGATVLIDQGEQRRAPIMEPVRLEAGKHTIEVTLAGYHALQRTVTVPGGTTLELSIALEPVNTSPVLTVTPAEPEAAAPPEAEASPAQEQAEARPAPAEAHESGSSTGIWIAGAITGVLAVTGAITGVLALKAEADFEAKHEQQLQAPTAVARADIFNAARDDADRAQALALTTDLLLFSAVIGGVVTVILIASDDGDGDTEEQASARLVPALSPHGGGVALHAGF
jgi:hypothetical protein